MALPVVARVTGGGEGVGTASGRQEIARSGRRVLADQEGSHNRIRALGIRSERDDFVRVERVGLRHQRQGAARHRSRGIRERGEGKRGGLPTVPSTMRLAALLAESAPALVVVGLAIPFKRRVPPLMVMAPAALNPSAVPLGRYRRRADEGAAVDGEARRCRCWPRSGSRCRGPPWSGCPPLPMTPVAGRCRCLAR